MISIECSFFLASHPKRSIGNTHIYTITKSEIGIYGELYTGNLIRSLGVHYTDYVNSTSVPVWRIHNRYSSLAIGRIKLQSEKHKSQAVTGNIGEAVVMPALESAINVNNFLFHRMKAHQIKCPDFRFCCDSSGVDKLWGTCFASSLGKTIDMPLEVKTHLAKDSGYLLSALDQLVRYWKECDLAGLYNSVGYGVIARIDLDAKKNPGSNHHFIRYFLFAKKPGFTIEKIHKVIRILKSKPRRKRSKSRYDKIQNWLIGRYML